MKNRNELEQHVKKILSKEFNEYQDKDLKIESKEEPHVHNLIFRIDWEISNNLQKPKKHSKIIILKLTSKVIDDYYLKEDKKVVEWVDAKLKQFIKEKLKTFDPEPKSEAINEYWNFTSDILLKDE